MPQNPDDPYGLGLRPLDSGTPDFDPYGLGLRPLDQEESNDWIETFLRTAPAVIGGIGGGILGGPLGGMAGGGLGSAAGNIAGNLYSGKEFNPWEFGVTTAFGAAPPILGPAKFAGQGLGAIAKYAGKNAALNAVEGAGINAIQTPFDQWAQTGSFDAPPEAYLANAGMGAVMGGGLGGAFGAYHGSQLGSAPSPPFVQESRGYRVLPDYPEPPKPRIDAATFAAMRNAKEQGIPYEPPGRIDTQPSFLQSSPEFAPPPPPPPQPPPTGGQGGGINIGMTNPNVMPEGSILSDNQQVVTISAPDPTTVAYWRNQGYVSVPGLTSAEGHVQMVRGDVAPLFITGDKRVPAARQQPAPDVPGAIGAEQVGVSPNQDVEIPNERANQPGFVENMAEGGFEVAQRGPTSTLFRRLLSDESGSVDIQGMWENLKKLLGRDPTPEEVERGMQRQVQPGEQTGRVARFPQVGGLDQPVPAQMGRPPFQDWNQSPQRPNDPFYADIIDLIRPTADQPRIEGEQAQGYPPGLMEDDDTDYGIMSFPNKGTPGSENISYLSDVPAGPNDRTVPSDRGQVAPTPTGPNLFQITQRLRAMFAPNVPFNEIELTMTMKDAENYIAQATESQARTDLSEVEALKNSATSNDEAEFLQHISDNLVDRISDLKTARKMADNEAGFGQIRPMGELRGRLVDETGVPTPEELEISRRGREQEDLQDIRNGINPDAYPMGPEGGLDVAGIRQRAMDPRMASRIEAVGGPRAFDFTQRTPETGQMDLPLVGDVRPPVEQGPGNPNIDPNVGMLQEPPRQPTMIDDLIDQEIRDRTREGPIPPEMVDLEQYRPSEMARPRRPYEDLTPDVYKRYHVYDENDNLIEKTYDYNEAHRWADQNDGYVKDTGEAPPKELKHPTAQRWNEYMRELDARKAPDLAYRDIFSTGSKNPLRKGETWRGRVQKGIEYFESTVEPSKMEVPGTRVGGGLSNIAVGGADEPVLDMLATALYTRDRPSTVVKELFQNAADEKKISGIDQPIRIAFRQSTENPKTGNGAKSVIVKDFGRGMQPEQLYTIFTDVGKSGKRDVGDASGGFGFAKAAPLLGGDYVRVESIVRDPDTDDLIRYTFEGSPAELKNQKKGVKLVDELVEDPDVKTGFKVEVFFPEDKYLHEAEKLIRQTVENSPGMKGIETFMDYSNYDDNIEKFLKEGKPTSPYYVTHYKELTGEAIPGKKGTISTPGAEIDIHFDLDNLERREGKVAYLNNGLFALEDNIGYGMHAMPHVPAKIVANVRATVQEGVEGYPFGLNREEMNREVLSAVKTWIRENVIKDAERIRIAELQRVFDDLTPAKGNSHVIMDSGNRYTPEELKNLERSPELRNVAIQMETMLRELDALFPVGQVQPEGQIGKTVKFGWQIHDSGKGGMNIPSPKAPPDAKEFAILINPLGLMFATDNPRIASQKMAHAILHEFNHNIARNEGAGFTWSLLQVDSHFGTERRNEIAKAIFSAITGPDGKYAPGVRKLLQEYTAARGRPDTTVDTLSRQRESEWLGGEGQDRVPVGDRVDRGEAIRGDVEETKGHLRRLLTDETGAVPLSDIADVGRRAISGIKNATGWGQGSAGKKKADEFNFVKEALAVPTNATTMMDLSAPGRQGLSMILTPEFWKASVAMFKGLNYSSYKQMDNDLRSKPLMQKKVDLQTGKVSKSLGEEIGIKLFSPASESGPRGEMTASRWLETGIGNGPLSKAWRHTAGYPIRATNRAFISFLNHLNVNRTEKLMNLARDMAIKGLETGRAPMPGMLGGMHLSGGRNIGFTKKVTPQEAMDMNPYHNIPLAKDIADFVNTATGHGPLKTHILPFKQAEVSLEAAAGKLGYVLFSPGLLASRMRMMNPNTYIMAPPFVRKQYAKAALSTAAAWYVTTQLLKNAAGPEAEVNDDITSADFGKVRIGDARLDLGGGFLQFAVAYGRAYMGGSTSSASGEFHRFGSGYQAQTQEDMMERFMVNKLNPMAKFAWDVASASEYNPMHVGDRAVQLFVPLFIQDLNEIQKENPELLPMFGPAAFLGGGTQIYSKGESVSKFIDPEQDWNVTGGGLRDIAPWNWNTGPGEKRTLPWSEPQ